tara:strand:+ start:409 stop:2022 length:1614 start_codon:yes stop_codon:yes gene_type:complete
MNKIPLSDIVTKSNVRQTVNTKSDKWAPFVENIKTHGLIQPIVCYEDNGKYVVIAGHRRLKAVQELDFKNVDIVVRNQPNGDLKAIQVSENLFREDLTDYEEVIAFKQMVNGENTIQEVADKYGCNYSYVRKRLQLANLLPMFLKASVFDDEELEELQELSTFHPTRQKEAYTFVKGKSKKSDKEFIETEDWASSMIRYLENGIDYKTMIELVGDEDRYAHLKRQFKYKSHRSLGLFDEILQDEIVTDADFIKYCAEQTYPEIYEGLMSIKVENTLNGWDDNCTKVNITSLKMFEEKKVDITKTIVSAKMENFPFEFILKTKPMKKSSDGTTSLEPIERGKYYGQVKKFAKATIPQYIEYLKSITHGNLYMGDTSEKVFNFIGKQGAVLSEISVGSHQFGYKTYEIFNSYPKDYKEGLSHWFHKSVESNLINETIYQCTINNLNKFAKLVGADNYKTWFLSTWSNKATSEDFRRNVWNCFNTKNLAKITTGKKSVIVEYATVQNSPFCFKDIFTSNENEWKDLSCKFNYLERDLIYK